jgi:hypothetical protein
MLVTNNNDGKGQQLMDSLPVELMKPRVITHVALGQDLQAMMNLP